MIIRPSLVPRTCPICQSRDHSRLYAESNATTECLDDFAFASRKMPEYMHWRLIRCDRCDLLYCDPAPRPEDLTALYRGADFDSRNEAHHASRTYSRLLARFIGNLPDREAAVDIGTGDGSFLKELLAAGFKNVLGIEPSSAPIEQADPSVRHLIRQDMFRAGLLEGASLSLVTCFQTIEHLSDPLSFCRAARQALKPSGMLFLIAHNRRAFSAKVLGRKSPIYDIEHMQLFSTASIRRLLEAAGFSGVETHPIFNRYPLKYWVKLFPAPRGLKERALGVLRASGFGKIVVPLPAGNMVALAYN
jgi:SAM-dependent methyltransferase